MLAQPFSLNYYYLNKIKFFSVNYFCELSGLGLNLYRLPVLENIYRSLLLSNKGIISWGWFRYSKLLSGGYKGNFLELELRGFGYLFFVSGGSLVIKIGFGHLVRYQIPASISLKSVKKLLIAYSFSSKDLFMFEHMLKSLRFDIYKGKGFNNMLLKRILKRGKVVKK